MALSLTVDEIMKQAGPMIIDQPQKNTELTFYSIEPTSTSTSLGEQICNNCEQCSMLALTCACAPVDWCSRNCCENDCDKAWCKGGSALGLVAAITLLVIFHPCS